MKLTLLAAAAFCLLTSCYPVKQYQGNLVGLVPPTPQFNRTIPLGFVEFDDNGQLFSRAQLQNTVAQIRRLRDGCPDSTVILFIHGWKNNAGADSNNVAGFEQFLRDFYADATHVDRQGSPKSGCIEPLMGIYIGWRGARTKVAANFSYWNGSNAAVRAGGLDLEDALFQIMCTARPTQAEKTNLILIGHSFGGRVLERVMTPYLETQILDELRNKTYSGGAMKFPLPTLTVLLNEAAPATDAKQFLDFLKHHNVTYRAGDRNVPLFLSITSDGDWANHIFLPIGQSAARLQMKTRVYCTGNAETDRKSGCSGDPADPAVITNQSTYFTHSTASIPALYNHYFVKGSNDAPQCQNHDLEVVKWRAVKDDYVFCQTAGAWNQTPYWVSSMPISIVPDHSDIFRPELSQTLISFIRHHLAETPEIQAHDSQ
jgi:hypothetical protein